MIRKAGAEDAIVAFDIRNRAIMAQCVAEYPLDDMQRWTKGIMPILFAKAFAQEAYVYELEGQIVATGMLSLSLNQLDALFVDPQFMGKGIGAQMVGYLERIALQHGVKALALEATLNAAAFYRQCGYIGDDVGVYHSPKGFDLACIPMVKTL
ncbi:GNAT family N-acetyltransferase [Shewanella maritima]|uniref:GNAT family N-acetyltransferase n=1 Tax=Shewanella maritima TaxID=2520507 RepID=UPI003735D390